MRGHNEHQDTVENEDKRKVVRGIDTIILLYILYQLMALRNGMLKKSDMIEHTFIVENNGIRKIQKISLPKDVPDKVIRKVAEWQKKTLKLN